MGGKNCICARLFIYALKFGILTSDTSVLSSFSPEVSHFYDPLEASKLTAQKKQTLLL